MTWRVAPFRVIDRPRPGYWAVRVRKGAVEVGARIYWTACPHCAATIEPESFPPNVSERSPTLAAEINGEPATLDEVWLRRGRPLSEADYRFLLADRAWAAQHAPADPAANPREPVNWLTAPLPLFGSRPQL